MNQNDNSFPTQELHLSRWLGFTVLLAALIIFPGNSFSQEPQQGLSLLQAVGLTVSLQPNILMRREQVNNQAGVLRQNTGKFDLTVKSSLEKKVEKTPLTMDQQESFGNLITTYDQDTLTTTVGLEKQFRTGIKIGPNMKVYRSGSNLDNFFMFNTVPDNYSTLNFTLEIPLLKGFGQDVAGADEKTAGVNLEATRLDLTHTVSQSVLTTVQAYWSYLGAKKKLEIYRESEGSASKLVDNLQQLVAAKENPVTDLVQSQASLAEKTALRITAEQQLLEAQKGLGLAMGLKSQEVLALPPPRDSYPEPVAGRADNIADKKEKCLLLAEKYRADLLALKEKEKAAQILLVAAQKNLKPELNATLGLGYGGLQESGNFKDYLNAVNHNTAGLNYSAALTFKYPLGNNAAQGAAAQRLAQRRQSHIQVIDLDRKIRSNVLVTLEALPRYRAGLKKAREAVALYRRGYDDENLRFRMGMSTIIDLITVQNRLSTAMVTEVDSHLDYANAIIRLRYETGTLILKEKEQYRLEMKRLILIPDANGAT